MPRIIDNIYAARMAALIYLDWTRWEAFKLGVIDRSGTVIKSPENSKEKASWTYFHNLAANIKRLIESVPGGKSKIGKLISLYAMYREAGNDDQTMSESFDATTWLTDLETVTEEYSIPEFRTYVKL